MLCKNCGKELKKGAAFCHECGAKAEINETVQANPIEANVPQSSMANTGGTASVKKMSKGKIILVAVFAILIFIVIACAMGGGDDSDKSSSNRSSTDIEELFYSSSEGLSVAEYVYNRDFSYEETEEDLYMVKVKGEVELGYIGSGAYQITTLTFELNADTGSCTFVDSTNISWKYLLTQYQYN